MTFNSQILPQFSSNLFEKPTYDNIKNPDINTSDNLLFQPLNLPTFSFTPKGDDLQNNNTPIVEETIDVELEDIKSKGSNVVKNNIKIVLGIALGITAIVVVSRIILKKSK